MKTEPAEIFKVLSVDTRVKILELLKCRGALGAKEMAASLGITVAAVSQHLKILKQAGLVKSERKGYWIPYSIDASAMENCRRILNQVCTCGCRQGQGVDANDKQKQDLQSLKAYEETLKMELDAVRQRIKGLKSTT